jgi:hypothetical protein
MYVNKTNSYFNPINLKVQNDPTPTKKEIFAYTYMEPYCTYTTPGFVAGLPDGIFSNQKSQLG